MPLPWGCDPEPLPWADSRAVAEPRNVGPSQPAEALLSLLNLTTCCPGAGPQPNGAAPLPGPPLLRQGCAGDSGQHGLPEISKSAVQGSPDRNHV